MPDVPYSSSPSLSIASSPETDQSPIVDVVLPRHLYRVFSYLVPTALQDRLQLGSQVLVPFGHTSLPGMIVGFRRSSDIDALGITGRGHRAPLRLREIIDILDAREEGSSAELLALSRKVSEYYLTPWGQCIRLIFPPSPLKKRRRYRLTQSGQEILHKKENAEGLSSLGRDVLLRLERRPEGLTIGTLRHIFGPTLRRELSLLKRRKTIEELEETQPVGRNEAHSRDFHTSLPPEVGQSLKNGFTTWTPRSATECAWREQVVTAIETNRCARFLIQGPRDQRASLAFELTDDVVKRQRRAIMIAPDITRAEALAKSAKSRWGDQVEVIHSGLSLALRNERRQRLRSPTVTILIGTRSAIFAPLSSIGLIYLDEEEHSSLKEEAEPRYHARDVAWMRAQLGRAIVLLGSSHSSVESISALTAASQNDSAPPGFSPILTLDDRDEPAPITTVDLRRTPYGTLLSDSMISEIRAALDTDTPIILFLNRRGFSTALACRDCGQSPQCTQCSVALTFHKRRGRLSCHYCSLVVPLPDTCPACHAARLQPSGIGTEAVEEQVRRLFPLAKVARLDADTSTVKQAASLRRKFLAGAFDILIGTQMLGQGEPHLSAGFVGLIQADAGLHLPDFRASEQTFHTLLDITALARPKSEGGKIVLQTLLPTHYVIRAVSERSPGSFYSQELAFRHTLGYPPFTQLISLRVSGTSPERTQRAAEDWRDRLHTTSQVTVWGPIPSPIAKVRQKYRWQILVNSVDGEVARRVVRQSLIELETQSRRSGLKFEVDVDPISTY